MTTSISSLFHPGIFRKHHILVSKVKTFNTENYTIPVSGFLNIFTFKIDRDIRKLTEILGN